MRQRQRGAKGFFKEAKGPKAKAKGTKGVFEKMLKVQRGPPRGRKEGEEGGRVRRVSIAPYPFYPFYPSQVKDTSLIPTPPSRPGLRFQRLAEAERMGKPRRRQRQGKAAYGQKLKAAWEKQRSLRPKVQAKAKAAPSPKGILEMSLM